MRLRTKIFVATFAPMVAVLFLSGVARAVEPDERLVDAGLETRARAISSELRCLVCQNQSIDDSNAPLARDLRLLVRERLSTGSTDAEVTRYIVDRYGEFVLLRPPFAVHTLVLWCGPVAILGAVLLGLWRRARGRKSMSDEQTQPLSEDEQKALDNLLKSEPPAA